MDTYSFTHENYKVVVILTVLYGNNFHCLCCFLVTRKDTQPSYACICTGDYALCMFRKSMLLLTSLSHHHCMMCIYVCFPHRYSTSLSAKVSSELTKVRIDKIIVSPCLGTFALSQFTLASRSVPTKNCVCFQ